MLHCNQSTPTSAVWKRSGIAFSEITSARSCRPDQGLEGVPEAGRTGVPRGNVAGKPHPEPAEEPRKEPPWADATVRRFSVSKKDARRQRNVSGRRRPPSRVA